MDTHSKLGADRRALVRSIEPSDFETLAAALLTRLRECVSEHVGTTQWRSSTSAPQVRRASIHIIANDGWRKSFAADWSGIASDDLIRSEVRRSSTLWSLISANDCTIGVVTATKDAHAYRSPSAERVVADKLEDVDPSMTFLSGAATHAIAIPLITHTNSLVGMVAIELHHTNIVDQLPWERWLPNLTAILDAGVPALLEVPPRAVHASGGPAIGTTTSEPRTNLVQRFAVLSDHILIRGPTGVGKTFLAKEIHRQSGRKGVLIPYNALSFPEDLQIAHLVGWKRGAFTGALTDRSGLLVEAVGGTIFIDEVDKLSLRAQKQLLSLTDRDATYTPLGATDPVSVGDVRFVFASNADLERAIRDGEFLHDLYFRIAEFPISLAPLSERGSEMHVWIATLLEDIDRRRRSNSGATNDRFSRQCSISPAALGILRNHDWPGNIRQLNTVLKRAYALAATTPDAVHIDESHVLDAFSLDRISPGQGIIQDLEALARKIVLRTQIELRDWNHSSPDPKVIDQTNPGTANFVRANEILFPMVWMVAEDVLNTSGRNGASSIAALLGKTNSVARKNFAAERTNAFRKLRLLYERLGETVPTRLADSSTHREDGNG